MKKILKVLLGISAGLFMLPNDGAAQKEMDWDIAKSLLYSNNISLKQSFLKEKIAKNNISIAKGNMYPNLTFTVNNQHTMGLVFDPVSGRLITGNQWSNYATGSFGTSVVIYQGGQKKTALEVEKVNLEITELETEKLLQELELQLLSAFTQALVNYDLWRAAKSQQDLSREQMKQEEALMNIGKRTLIDVAQVKAKFANDNFNTITSKNSYELSLSKLRQILDINDSEEVNVKLSHAPEKPLEQHNDHKEDLHIKIVGRQLELQEKKIKLARSNYFPRLTFNGSYGSNYSSQRQNDIYNETTPFWNQINQNRTLYGNFSLSIPLFDGFITKNNINSAQISKRSLLYEKEKQIVERNQVHRQALLEYRASKEELNALEIACEANKISYNAINERYKIGKSSSIDLYKAMTEYNVSEYKLITSRYKVFYQRTFLEIIGY